MTAEEWEKIKYFRPNGGVDKFGEPGQMDYQLMLFLDAFRHKIGRPCLVTCGTQGVHVKNSQHYSGNAVDFVIDCGDRSKFDIYLEAMRFPFTGLGIYPDWVWGGVKNPLGMHVDNRAIAGDWGGKVQKRWMGIKNKDQTMQYMQVCETTLKDFGIL